MKFSCIPIALSTPLQILSHFAYLAKKNASISGLLVLLGLVISIHFWSRGSG
jgi:hypothetical protein